MIRFRVFRNLVKSLIQANKNGRPLAAELYVWEDLDRQQKLSQPVKYFILETLPTFLDRLVIRLYNRIIDKPTWFLKYRFCRKHQYHIIRPKTLKPGYHEISDRILHGVMHEVVEYYFEQASIVAWDESPYKEAYQQMAEIVKYWIDQRPDMLLQIDGGYPPEELSKHLEDKYGYSSLALMLHPTLRKNSDVKQYLKYYDNVRKIERKIETLDQKYLKAAVNIRNFLWS